MSPFCAGRVRYGNGKLEIGRHAFVRDWDLNFSVVREGDIFLICAGRVFVRERDFTFYHGTAGLYTQSRRINPEKCLGKCPLGHYFNYPVPGIPLYYCCRIIAPGGTSV